MGMILSRQKCYLSGQFHGKLLMFIEVPREVVNGVVNDIPALPGEM